ncbi:MAG: hypothetical protein KC766_26810 [Myxococcales bacterium]|nr:hypothetical protein [Myxococcales bacterium]
MARRNHRPSVVTTLPESESYSTIQCASTVKLPWLSDGFTGAASRSFHAEQHFDTLETLPYGVKLRRGEHVVIIPWGQIKQVNGGYTRPPGSGQSSDAD